MREGSIVERSRWAPAYRMRVAPLRQHGCQCHVTEESHADAAQATRVQAALAGFPRRAELAENPSLADARRVGTRESSPGVAGRGTRAHSNAGKGAREVQERVVTAAGRLHAGAVDVSSRRLRQVL